MFKQVGMAVVGSVNMDLVTNAPRFPRMGETLLGADFNRFMDGKRTNRAVTATRLGADVRMIGAVGDDGFSYEMLINLDHEGVCGDCAKAVQGYSSGIANIIVAGGENSIIAMSDANFALTPKDVLAHEETIVGSDVVLSQLEIPMECAVTATKLAQKHGKSLVSNPTPARRLPQELLGLTTLLMPSTYELTAGLGLPQNMSTRELISRSPCPVLMTADEKGAVYNDEQGVLHYVPGFPVTPVDSTGAGDTFNGTFTVYWKEDMGTAVRKTYTAAAVSITQNGAQSGIPSEEELEEFLAIRR